MPSVHSMHAAHHGREIHCLQLLQAPAPHQAIAVITGGEDSTLRSFLFHDGGVSGMVRGPRACRLHCRTSLLHRPSRSRRIYAIAPRLTFCMRLRD